MTRAERRAQSLDSLRIAPRAAAPRSVHVHINDLVLWGVPAASARRVSDGLTNELARLFGRGGVPLAMTLANAAPRVDAGTVRAASASAGLALGRSVAGAVYRVGRR